jgi:hypothetical protein
MFLEPELFTAALAFRQEQSEATRAAPGEPNSGAPADSLRSQSLHYRFWQAKAKREGGGWEPTSDEVSQVRQRYGQ